LSPLLAANVLWFDGVEDMIKPWRWSIAAIDAIGLKSRSSVFSTATLGRPSSQLRRKTDPKRTWETKADVCCGSYQRTGARGIAHVQRQIWSIGVEIVVGQIQMERPSSKERRSGSDEEECDEMGLSWYGWAGFSRASFRSDVRARRGSGPCTRFQG
jgi:hypothetical protein